MKLQCPCGAKYDFEITPDMARNPVRFVCPSCGLDSSDFVNGMIRQELSAQAAAGAGELAEPALTAAPRLRVAHTTAAHNEPAPAPSPVPTSGRMPICSKHPRQQTVEHCVVCRKPICPLCMELFGYVCSPACQANATAHGINVPVYAGQRNVVEAKRWRKLGALGAVLGLLVIALLGVWIWYAWFGSVPRPVFSVRFEDRVYSGMSTLCGQDQIVFLRGGSLARYDLKTKKEIWSRELLDKAKIEKIVDRQMKIMQAIVDKANSENPDNAPKMPSREKLLLQMTRSAEAALQLRVSGQNVWVVAPEKFSHLDWESGRTLQEIPRALGFGRLSVSGNELVFTALADGLPAVSHLNLASGEVTTEKIGGAVQPDAVAVAASNAPGAGLPIGRSGADGGKSLDPDKVAGQAQNLSLPGRIALPALLAGEANQERALAEMSDHPKSKPAGPSKTQLRDRVVLFPSQFGNVELSVHLLEEKFVARSAMKAAPKKSALAGDLTVAKTADVANEILNEQQRARGGDTVVEDESRYQVTVHLPGANGAADWTGEVTGPPEIFPLKTVNVLTANKTLIVLDKANKKLWQAELTYNVSGGAGGLDEGESVFGQGPCVERGDLLLVFDQAVLTAFELTTGNARWRLPSVGVVGLFFDDAGMLYVNTTTADPDKLRYSRQIDITDKTSAMIYKLDPKSGRVLWNTDAHGFIAHVSGKFIYTMQSFDPGDEEDGGNDLTEILRKPPFLRIRRIDPGNGHKLWEHFQERAPLDVRFDGRTIELVFKKEVQVLKYLAW